VARTWFPESWRELPAAQQPEWDDPGALDLALKELRNQPPLVFAGEARALKAALGAASQGEAFVLQAGECAESFDNLSADSIRDQLKIPVKFVGLGETPQDIETFDPQRFVDALFGA